MHVILGTMTFSDQVDRDGSIAMIDAFREAGHRQMDTAYVYNKGQTEVLLGTLNADSRLSGLDIATKVNPSEAGGLSAASVDRQFGTSLQRLGVDAVDLLYLHSPDLDTPIMNTLEAVQRHYDAGRFARFGLSNYAAWQVAEIVEICRREGWVVPSVYQGMYNAYTRDIERELIPCLANYDMAFYAYNPLAGGMLTGKHTSVDATPDGGRFGIFTFYQERYWKADYFEVVRRFADVCGKEGIAPAAAALRWMVHHSALSGNADNGVILGASSLSHLQQNLQAVADTTLPESILTVLDEGWEQVRPTCMKYFRP